MPPLALPQRNPPPTLEQLSQYEAVRLFIERAQAVRPGFAIDNSTAPAVAEICHRLDGLPLAIELAAARLRLLPPQAMLTRLEQRLPLLTGGARDAPARQQTLRQTIAWSYDLLEPEEQALYRRLAVFSGGFALEAAEAVANPGGEVDVLAGVSALVDHNLVHQAEVTRREPRFTMLETIREFGLERLRASDEEDESRARHARWYREMIASLDLYHANAGDETWFGLVQAEEDNLRQALGWFATHDDAYALNELSAALFKFWLAGSRFREGRHWLEQAIARDEGLPLLIRSRARGGIGHFAAWQGDYATAVPLLAEGLALARASGDPNRLTEALLESGTLASFQDDPQQSLVHNREAEQVARGMTSAVGPLLASVALSNQGWALRDIGELDEALIRFDEAVALTRAPGGAWSLSVALRGRGALRVQLGDTTAATADLIEALALIWQRRDWGSLTAPLREMAGAAALTALTAQPVHAMLLLGAADGIDRSIGQEAVAAVRERATIEHCLHQARELGVPRQAELRRAGEALVPEQAVALVREVARVVLGDEQVAALWAATGAPDPGPVPPSPELAPPSSHPAPRCAPM